MAEKDLLDELAFKYKRLDCSKAEDKARGLFVWVYMDAATMMSCQQPFLYVAELLSAIWNLGASIHGHEPGSTQPRLQFSGGSRLTMKTTSDAVATATAKKSYDTIFTALRKVAAVCLNDETSGEIFRQLFCLRYIPLFYISLGPAYYGCIVFDSSHTL